MILFFGFHRKLLVKMKIKIQKTDNEVKVPDYAHEGDSGMDLYAAEECILKPMERKLVSAGIKIEIPKGYEAQVRPKSGLALSHGISIVNTPGTIDSGYRGVVGVILINLGKEPYKVEKNKKIAQLVISKVENVKVEVVELLEETKRGEGGFGSTGLH